MRRNCAWDWRAFLGWGISLLMLACAPAVADTPRIDFTLRSLKEPNVEGPDVERTYITVASRRMVVAPPKECRANIEGANLVLRPTGLEGEIIVSQSPFTPDFAFAANALKYRDTAEESIPRGGTDIQVTQPVMNPYPFNGWKSLGFTWEYVMFGRAMTRSVVFLNLDENAQVMIVASSVRKDAEQLQKLAKHFLASWWWKDS